MKIIGELINGMYKAVAKAIDEKDTGMIQRLAREQVAGGASALDINAGPFSKDPMKDMLWLVETARKSVDAPLSIDSTKPDVIEECLKIAGKGALINSTSADDDKMERIFPLAMKYGSQVIALAMDRSGVPNSREKRVELAANIVSKAVDLGMDPEDIYLDPIAMPVNVAQAQGTEVLETIRDFRMICDPSPQTVIGLSNVSQGAKNRRLINRTFLVMAMANGLTAAILDPLDKDLIEAMITADLIANKNIYCDSFLDACRKK